MAKGIFEERRGAPQMTMRDSIAVQCYAAIVSHTASSLDEMNRRRIANEAINWADALVEAIAARSGGAE